MRVRLGRKCSCVRPLPHERACRFVAGPGGTTGTPRAHLAAAAFPLIRVEQEILQDCSQTIERTQHMLESDLLPFGWEEAYTARGFKYYIEYAPPSLLACLLGLGLALERIPSPSLPPPSPFLLLAFTFLFSFPFPLSPSPSSHNIFASLSCANGCWRPTPWPLRLRHSHTTQRTTWVHPSSHVDRSLSAVDVIEDTQL